MTIKLTRRTLLSAMPAMVTASALAGCGGSSDTTASVPATPAATPSADDVALKFDATAYTTVNVTLDGVAIKVRQYRRVYVAKPIKMASVQSTLGGATVPLADPYAYQTMIVSVVEALVDDQTQPMYVVVNNSGWFTSAVSTSITEGRAFISTNNTDPIGAALKAGYVVVNLGTRSRGARAEDGRWAGKAPAPVVDTKAAIRYLRLNDSLMPGTSTRIVLTGTSGGGGLTAAVAASGNSADYLPFLAAVGAAGIDAAGTALKSTLKDDVFAAVAYCPINNLGNADAGYEWEYNTTRNDTNTNALGSVPATVPASTTAYSAGPQRAASLAMANSFPAYLNGLGLKRDDGTALTDTNLRDVTKAILKKEIENQIARGVTMPAKNIGYFPDIVSGVTPLSGVKLNTWLSVSAASAPAQTVIDIDYPAFLTFVAAGQKLKTVVAFDAVGVTGNTAISGESNLFGSESAVYANFSAWSWANNAVPGDGSGVDDTGLSWDAYLASSGNTLATQLRLVNPIAYLNTVADTAPYWYVRHGMIDRDTAFAMQIVLAYALKNTAKVKDINFNLPYLRPHSGNYDVQEAFTWIKAKLQAAG